MARIAIVKVRTAHDLEWRLPPALLKGLGMMGLHHFRDRVNAVGGQPFMPQLTLPYLAALGQAYNEAHGTQHTFELIDHKADQIRLQGFDMVWFTGVTPTIGDVYRLSDAARRMGILTVIGGIHATMMPGEVGAHADAVAIGDGEQTVPRLLADYDRSGRLEPIYRGRRVGSLEGLPRPRWRDAQFEDYCPWLVPVQTSRGCRNACHFCSTTRYQGARRRHRPVQEIVDEIQWLKDEGILTPDKVVFFTDNNIVSDSDHRRGIQDTSYARELFRALEPLNVLWTGQGEINVARDPELTALLARAGCFLLLVGFETIDPQNLSSVGKPCNQVEDYAEQIETLHRQGISLIGCFILGMDNDSPASFERTRRFIEKYIDVPQLSLMTPFPGTALHRRLRRDERLLHEDWSQYDVLRAVFEPRGMSAEELTRGYHWLSDRIYSYSSIVRRAMRAATRRVDYMHPMMTRANRVSSVLAPNLVYRRLAHLSRDAGLRTRQRRLVSPARAPAPVDRRAAASLRSQAV